MKQTMVIVGLGLIGGSLALALKGFEDFEIVGVDVSQPTLRYAAEHGVGDRVTEDAAAELPQADVVALALHPQGIVRQICLRLGAESILGDGFFLSKAVGSVSAARYAPPAGIFLVLIISETAPSCKMRLLQIPGHSQAPATKEGRIRAA